MLNKLRRIWAHADGVEQMFLVLMAVCIIALSILVPVTYHLDRVANRVETREFGPRQDLPGGIQKRVGSKGTLYKFPGKDPTYVFVPN